MKFPGRRLSTVGIIVSAMAVPATITATAANAATIHGCPSGYVCIYPGAGWNNDQPSNEYYKYGCYKLYNQYGTHRVLNNQTGYAPTDGYTSSNCSTGFEYYIASGGAWADVNLTPVNSIDLVDN
ncbi:hypothetical protein [Actinoallomurus sp. NPDC050550]|uniref:hypothetical protein n=1 Tax=Actinoallomurus sp. NPDC050550 TaxID=3154937 RepID=UPI0033C1A70F